MRAEEFVGGAGKEVASKVFNIDEAVRSKVYGVEKCQSTDLVSQSANVFHRIDRTDGVGRTANSDQPGPIA